MSIFTIIINKYHCHHYYCNSSTESTYNGSGLSGP